MADTTWTARYLAVLGLAEEPPSLEWLGRFGEAHLRHVPFENFTSLRRSVAAGEGALPPLDTEALLAGWERGAGGGVCFEVATMVSEVLASLGYDAYPVLGQISFPASHQAVVVRLEGAHYLIDLGNGAPMPQPIPLDRVSEYHAAGLSYRFRPDLSEMTCVQDRLIDGTWTPFCQYDLNPASDADRDAGYRRHHDPAESWVAGSITLVRYMQDEGEVLQVRDGAFTRHTAEGKHTTRVTDTDQLRHIVAEAMHLPGLPFEEALSALRRLTDTTL